jgi:protein-S-isoprenylcysteine O-methyltransferase Ste14
MGNIIGGIAMPVKSGGEDNRELSRDNHQERMLFWRALLAFLALPGMVAFAVPLLAFAPRGLDRSFSPIGLVPLAAGIIFLLWTVRDFYVAGRGTLAPWSPPKELVVVGLYRVSRNPMYVAVLLILVGWAVGFRSIGLTVYAFAIATIFQVRVVFGEEPWLERTHGQKWAAYKARVPRWLGWRTLTSTPSPERGGA